MTTSEIIKLGLEKFGAATEETAFSLKRGRIMSDYVILDLDLGTPRTNVKLGDDIQGIIELARSTGATYSLKLFDTDRGSITQADMDAMGKMIADFGPAPVFITNSAQSGQSVRLFLARG